MTHCATKHPKISQLIGLALLAGFGCDYESAPRTKRGVPSRQPELESTPGKPAKAAAREPLPARSPRTRVRQLLTDPALAKAVQEKTGEKGESEKERDYEAELRGLVGNPLACFAPRASDQAPESVSISLEAHVTSSGVVSRAYASSTALSPQELTCLRQRMERAHFRAPVPDAPRTVRTTIEVRQKSQREGSPRLKPGPTVR